jgi:integrase
MIRRIAFALCLLLFAAVAVAQTAALPALDQAEAARFARLALDCIEREYPNKISVELRSDADARPPRQLTPAFYGCYDWHSSVHGHWLLVRLLRRFPEADFAAAARAALARNLTAAHVAGELAFLHGQGDETFERPYGLAWLLQLAAELHGWDDAQAREWSQNLAPLESEVVQRLQRWLPKLTRPIRVGEHTQTAFAFGLALDWAERGGDAAFADALRKRIREFYFDDRRCPLDYEPSGQDFLSPCLAEADLLRRVLAPREFAAWLDRFLPQIPRHESDAWLIPGEVRDHNDGKLAHLDGLNLSRAWMLRGIATGLPPHDPRVPALEAAMRRHAQAGLTAVSEASYYGSHWLGSFAAYLLTNPAGRP